jgi:hypothetical protein
MINALCEFALEKPLFFVKIMRLKKSCEKATPCTSNKFTSFWLILNLFIYWQEYL